MLQAAPDLLRTQNPQTVYIDRQGRHALCAFQWLLEKSQSHPIRTGNHLQAFIAGEKGFAAIAADIERAKDSVDLVCWGFDPGMAFVRQAPSKLYPWAHGEPYGELLKRKAAQGVKVRLLVWYSPRGSAKQNSLVGYVEQRLFVFGGVRSITHEEARPVTKAMAAARAGFSSSAKRAAKAPLSVAEQRLDYCTEWWRAATGGQIDNLEVRCRDGVPDQVMASVADEPDQPKGTAGTHLGFISERMLLEDNASHHQKTVLIDYAHDEGSHAVGYIMGLNSLSRYWDREAHAFDDPGREVDFAGESDEVAELAAQAGQPISSHPWQDYALRIEGMALVDVHQNFCTAWNRAKLLPKLLATSNACSKVPRSADLAADLQPRRLAKSGMAAQALRLQVLRTQPEESYTDSEQCWPFDKSIKHAYFQASSFARSYIYLENQYFFYEEWARHLKANRQAFMSWVQAAGRTSRDARLLHLMVVIPLPEDEGMLPRTFDTLKSLGQASAMPDQRQAYKDQEGAMASQQAWDEQYKALSRAEKLHASQKLGPRPQAHLRAVTRTAQQVREPTLDPEGVLMQDGQSLGLKVLICKMITPNLSGKLPQVVARDVYIHSKLLLIDDCFMTLGSANLNLRSMAADSEINLATDSIAHVRDLRQRVWAMQTGGLHHGGAGTPTAAEMKKLFEHWQKLAQDNAHAVKEAKPADIRGHLAKFVDKRTAFHRYG